MSPVRQFRRAAAIFLESEADRTRRGHRENAARDPVRTWTEAPGCKHHTYRLFGPRPT